MDLTYYRNGVKSKTSTITKPNDSNPFFFGGDAKGNRWKGWISDIRIYDNALSWFYIRSIAGKSGMARDSKPGDLYENVPLYLVPSWTPEDYALRHNVYFGTDSESLELVADEQTDTNYPSTEFLMLELGRSYYWRIDEVNELFDPCLWSGDLWKFTVNRGGC